MNVYERYSAQATHNAARVAVGRYGERLLQSCGLIGVGVGLKRVKGQLTDEPVVKAFTVRKRPGNQLWPFSEVPVRFSMADRAVRSDVEELEAPSAPPRLTMSDDVAAAWLGDWGRHRPVAGGESVSHLSMPLGTLAIAVVDNTAPGTVSILSCNHVLAALNLGRPGDAILQPAVLDGGATPLNVCGTLTRFVPVQFGGAGSNLVDAAVARVDAAWPWIRWIGEISGVRSGNSLQVGERVKKAGRTTALTQGEVVATYCLVWIPYPPSWSGGVALFKDQILVTAMAAFGDSGSLVLDTDQRAVGLLFGGSGTHSVFCDITHIESTLGIMV